MFLPFVDRKFWKEFIRELLNLSANEKLTAGAFRNFLASHYQTNELVKTQFKNYLELLEAFSGITANEIKNLLSVDIQVAKCIAIAITEPDLSPDERLNLLTACASRQIQKKSMVSQVDTSVFFHIINEKLREKHNRYLSILTFPEGKTLSKQPEKDKDLILSTLKTAFDNIIRKNIERIQGDTRVHFLITDNTHYRYIVKQETDEKGTKRDITGIPCLISVY